MISTKKAELNAILTQFNIFVDNPVNVLTQEESKKFIQGQEKDKYEFFLKVTMSLHCLRVVSFMLCERQLD